MLVTEEIKTAQPTYESKEARNVDLQWYWNTKAEVQRLMIYNKEQEKARVLKISPDDKEKLGKIYLPWTSGTQYLHFKLLQSALAASTPRLLVNE